VPRIAAPDKPPKPSINADAFRGSPSEPSSRAGGTVMGAGSAVVVVRTTDVVVVVVVVVYL